jgi:thiol-disulfide isomerase/thioredoxin
MVTAETSKYQVADGTDGDAGADTTGTTGSSGGTAAGSGSAPSQPPALPSGQLDSHEVPDGTAEELLAFIEKMKKELMVIQQDGAMMSQQNRSVAEVNAMLQEKLGSVAQAQLKAADKIMAKDGTPTELRRRAIDAKLSAMGMLTGLSGGATEWPDKVRAFAQSLSLDKDPQVALQGRTILLGFRVGDLNRGDQNYEILMNELNALLADENRDRGVMDIAQTTAMRFQDAGRLDVAQEAFRAIAAAFKDHSDPTLATEAKNITDWLATQELELNRKVEAVAGNKAGADEALAEAMKTVLLDNADPGEVILEESRQVVGQLERIGKYQLGVQIAQMVEQAFQNSDNEGLKQMATNLCTGAIRRMELVGKPLAVEGSTLDGKAIDLSNYQGKVVLLDFWATWCGPCMEELPNLRRIYEAYHPHGFEVIGINLDDEPQALSDFLTSQQLPWVNIRGREMAQKCGVDTIPFVVLLDQNGNVLDLHLTGQALEEKLTKLLGPPASAATPDAGQPNLNAPKTNQSSLHRRRGAAASMNLFAAATPGLDGEGESLFFSRPPTRP